MATVATDLDRCQRQLRDGGRIWPRAELLRLYNDAYRQLLARAHGVRQFRVLEVPPRHTMTITYPWEKRYTLGGTSRQWTYTTVTGSRSVYTYAWEVERAEGYTPSTTYTAVTHLWELAYATGTVDTAYRFALPKSHEVPMHAWWDNKRLEPVATRELDALEYAWYREQGEPWHLTPGGGDSRTFELYAIRAAYESEYAIYTDGLGMPRSLEPGDRAYTTVGETPTHRYAYTTQGDSLHQQAKGSGAFLSGLGLRITQDPVAGGYQGTQVWEHERHEGATTFTEGLAVGTYPWEADYGAENMTTLGLGCMRQIMSTARQYVVQASWEAPLGTIRAWGGSEGALLVHEALIPDVPDVSETDMPAMVPQQLQKYLRYYVLAHAFNRQGRGYRPDLAAHFQLRWQRGIRVLRRLGDLTRVDYQPQRTPVTRDRRGPPLAQLPSEYPAYHGWR